MAHAMIASMSERYPTLRAAETSIGDYIENFYDVERLHSTCRATWTS